MNLSCPPLAWSSTFSRSTARSRLLFGWAPAVIALGLSLHQAPAAASTESFDYSSSNTLAGFDGGSGWLGAWGSVGGNGAIMVEDDSLTYPGVVSTGGKMHFVGVAGAGTTTSCYRYLAEPLTNGTYYARILARNLNNGRRYFGLAFFNDTKERMLLGQGSTYANWTVNHISGISTNNTLQSDVNSSAVALLVVKIELQEGPERITFWVNPDLSKPEDVTTAVGGSANISDWDFVSISRVRLGGGGYSATVGGDPTDHYLDEISISTASPFVPCLTVGRQADSVILSWPPEFLGWSLQVQTNSPTTGFSTWTGTDIPGTDLVTSTNLLIDPSQSLMFRLHRP